MTDEYLSIQLWAIIVHAIEDLIVLFAGHPEWGSICVQLN